MPPTLGSSIPTGRRPEGFRLQRLMGMQSTECGKCLP